MCIECYEFEKEDIIGKPQYCFTMHPGGNKMYRDMKRYYWW